MAKDVTFEGYTKMSGPDLIVKNKNEFKIELVLNSEVKGEELVKLLKKNK